MRIAVVGGGPGGSCAAERLARRGARVVVYEPRRGWEKPCGGGVPERGVDFCPALKDPTLPHQVAARARLFSSADREAVVPLAEPLRVYSRRDLNGFLLERAGRAGAEIRSLRVAGLDRDGSGWRVRDATGGWERYDFLVGADGASGIVRTRVAEGGPPLEQTVGLGYYAEGYTSDEIILKFFPGLDGYLWVFPRTDHLAVGICGPTGPGQAPALMAGLEGFLVDFYGTGVLKRLRKYGARIPLPPVSIPARLACRGEGWALIGDAAGFVDPLTREGIHYAIASGHLLSEALSRGRPEAYPERWEQVYGGELARAAGYKARFFSRRFVESFTLLAAVSPAIRAVVSDLIAGRQPYRSLRGRLSRCAPAAGTALALTFLERILVGRRASPPPSLTPVAG